jgi:hypothetical protein
VYIESRAKSLHSVNSIFQLRELEVSLAYFHHKKNCLKIKAPTCACKSDTQGTLHIPSSVLKKEKVVQLQRVILRLIVYGDKASQISIATLLQRACLV